MFYLISILLKDFDIGYSILFLSDGLFFIKHHTKLTPRNLNFWKLIKSGTVPGFSQKDEPPDFTKKTSHQHSALPVCNYSQVFHIQN